MKKVFILVASAVFLATSCQESMQSLTDRVFDRAVKQFTLLDSELPDGMFPRNLREGNGELRTNNAAWWCCGFFPGSLWYTYEYTGNEGIKALAEKNTAKIALDGLKQDHDLGFEVWCSYGNALRLTGDEKYKPAIEGAARMLATRFNPTVKCIRSWNHATEYRVIIDNMMNLELLEESAKLFSCDSLANVASIHAYTTMANHFRPDFSSYHMVVYDEQDGSVVRKATVQGYADDSWWGRGQAWGLYGYTMMFRETGDENFLKQAEAIGDLLVANLPEDGVTYWDFSDHRIPNIYRDASAAAVMASAFVELSTFASTPARAASYKDEAETILRTLASDEYLCKEGECHGFLLKHSVGNLNAPSEIDTPLTYADYYFLEALLRYSKLK